MRILTAAMNLYAWSLAATIVFFLYLIAKFFEEKAGQRSYYQIFLVPMMALVVGALQYVVRSGDFVGDILGDSLLLGGGLILLLMGSHLFHLMVRGKK